MGVERGLKPGGRRIQGPGDGAQANDPAPFLREFYREKQVMLEAGWGGDRPGVLPAVVTQKCILPFPLPSLPGLL